MTKKERALLAVQTLEEVYPQATCALQYEKPYELLIAVRLSAQCTDARVNQITPKLFAAYPTLVAELFKAFGNGIFYSHDEVHLNMIVQKFVQLRIRNCVHRKNVL